VEEVGPLQCGRQPELWPMALQVWPVQVALDAVEQLVENAMELERWVLLHGAQMLWPRTWLFGDPLGPGAPHLCAMSLVALQ